MIQIFGHAKCKGTRAAARFFSDRRVKVHEVDLTQKGLAKGELDSVARAVGGVARLYDAGGAHAKARGLAHAGLSDDRLRDLLLADARLLLTPIVRLGARAAVGVDEAAWRAFADELKQAR
ncbi:MAG: hypothetical protein IT374_17635 [Polyangiaceae bacterium]|nr:hypothetical protein [Polyangiaceae bacterium]